MSVFRLIDVIDKKIVLFKTVDLSQIKYIALSYVWGSDQKLMLRKQNYSNLQNYGSLQGLLPRTIDDALYFTGTLGVQYLWVDALCIIQDDDADKAIQLGKMGSIYANSLLTIIAAAGVGVGAGLPGVRVPREAVQEEVVIQKSGQELLSLLTTLSPTQDYKRHYTEHTVWASRGWTLQERVLTQRAIIFLNEQILWSCGESNWAEETCSETSLAQSSWYALNKPEFILRSWLRNLFPYNPTADQAFYKFPLLVRDFTGRKLTKSGDAHDAFSAILQYFRELDGECFLWGLPTSYFESTLCWKPRYEFGGLKRRRCLTTLKMTSLNCQVPFPSWSWLGWEGNRVYLSANDNDVR